MLKILAKCEVYWLAWLEYYTEEVSLTYLLPHIDQTTTEVKKH